MWRRTGRGGGTCGLAALDFWTQTAFSLVVVIIGAKKKKEKDKERREAKGISTFPERGREIGERYRGERERGKEREMIHCTLVFMCVCL